MNDFFSCHLRRQVEFQLKSNKDACFCKGLWRYVIEEVLWGDDRKVDGLAVLLVLPDEYLLVASYALLRVRNIQKDSLESAHCVLAL